jgi:PII-like signaling protein
VLGAGPAKRVTIYVGEEHKHHGQSLYAAILDFLFYRGISGASVVKGIAGFGADHHLHTDRIEALSQNLPVKIEFIESPGKVEEVLPQLRQLAGTGLIEIQDTTVVKPAETSAQKQAAESATAALKRQGKAKLMRIFIGENDKWRDQPLYKALLESMRANGIAGATVYQGILGYGASTFIRHAHRLVFSHDAPLMVSVVDEEEKSRSCCRYWATW